MDAIIVLLLLAIFVCMVVLIRHTNDLRHQTRKLNQAHQSRQVDLTTKRVGHTSTPTVDARARTTKRDTADLPLTGRQSIGLKRTRRGGESRDRISHDDRLP